MFPGFGFRTNGCKYASQSLLHQLSVSRRDRLAEQNAKTDEWAREESQFNGNSIDYNFVTGSEDASKVKMDELDYRSIPWDRNKWREPAFATELSASGLRMEGKLTKIDVPIHLKSLAAVISVHFTLANSSSLSFALRSFSLRNPETIFVIFEREFTAAETHLFVLIGVYNSDLGEIALVKKTEIPLISLGDIETSVRRVPLNIEVKIIDNGDDLIILEARVGENEFVTEKFVYGDFIVPVFPPSYLYVFGDPIPVDAAGEDQALIKRIKIQQIPRERNHQALLTVPPKASCCECMIF